MGQSQGSAPPECNGEPRLGGTAFVIMVSPVPGKYAGLSLMPRWLFCRDSGLTMSPGTWMAQCLALFSCVRLHGSNPWQTPSLLQFIKPGYKGIAPTQSPANKNCSPESPTFGAMTKVSLNRSAIEGPRSGGTASWIKVSPVPGNCA